MGGTAVADDSEAYRWGLHYQEATSEGRPLVRRLLILPVAAALLMMATVAQGGVTSKAESICRNDRWVEWGFSKQGQCVRSEARGLLWVLNEQFLHYPDQLNPNPDRYGNSATWSFLAAEAETVGDPSTYSLLEYYNVGTGENAGQEGWEFESVVGSPEPWTYPYVHSGTQGSPVSPHPGSPGRDPEYAIVGWTSPFEGIVRISGGVWDGDEAGLPGSGCPKWLVDGVTWDIRTSTSNEMVAQGQIDDGGRQDFPSGLTVEVSVGTQIWFAIGPQANFYCDSTRTSIVLVGETR